MPAAIHPLLIHFPVALLLTGTAALLWSIFRSISNTGLQSFISGALGLGYAGLVLAVITGLYDLQASPKALARENWVTITVLHLICGVLLLAVYGFLLYRRFFFFDPLPTPPEKDESLLSSKPESNLQTETRPIPALKLRTDRATVALAIAGIILLVVAAWLGGMLVYDYRVGIQ